MNKELKRIIAGDKYNLLRDNENRIVYFLRKLIYKIEILITNKQKL